MEIPLYIKDNWDSLIGYLTTLGTAYGWYRSEIKAKKEEIRKDREHDVSYWKNMLEAQDVLIERTRQRLDSIVSEHNTQIEQIRMTYDMQIDRIKQELQRFQEENERLKQQILRYESN